MRDRARDYAILIAASALLTLPNLGATSLWDDDESVNAQAAREMRDAGTWVVPTFNYQLRTAKPVMLYWLQRASYAAFGVSEWSARLPSALAGWLAVLLTYELARRMFGRAAGLLAGVVLASVFQFGLLVHAATPDSPLLLFTCLTYLAFWAGHANGSCRWWVPTAAACGLAMLTKGPVGVAIPGLVILAYFIWTGEPGRLLDRKIVWAALTFLLVAGPWYGIVAGETRGEWVKAFFGRENVGRFSAAMEGHRGPIAYYLAVIPIMFAPWSAFLAPVVWSAVKGARQQSNPLGHYVSREGGESPTHAGGGRGEELSNHTRAYRFLICWIVSYLVVFSAAATKLPNYVFPLYPALAILTARFLVAWRDGTLAVPRWVMPAAVGAMVLVAAGFAGGLAVADRTFPGLGQWALLGLVPLAGAAAMALALRRDDRAGFVTAAAVSAVAFLGMAVALPPTIADRQKAPKDLVRDSGADDPTRDLRVGAFAWFEPSVVFYSGREVRILESAETAAEFLAVPTPGYLFVAEPVWNEWVANRVAVPHRVAARHYDFLKKCDVLVITNDLRGGDVAGR